MIIRDSRRAAWVVMAGSIECGAYLNLADAQRMYPEAKLCATCSQGRHARDHAGHPVHGL